MHLKADVAPPPTHWPAQWRSVARRHAAEIGGVACLVTAIGLWLYLLATGAAASAGWPLRTAVLALPLCTAFGVWLYLRGRQADRSLRDGESLFRTMADTAPVLMWLAAPDKLCIFFNKGWLDFTGRTLEQERGNGWAAGVHPEDLPSCLATYHGAFDRREPFAMEYRLRDRDGVYRWVRDEGVPRYGADGQFAGYVGCAVDITERHAQVAALRASEERHRDVLNTQADLVCRYLLDGTLTFVNEAYCRYLGRDREALIGASYFDFVPTHGKKPPSRYTRQPDDCAEPLEIEREVIRPDGTSGWHHWVARPIVGPDGVVREYQATGRDITERKRAEEAHRRIVHASRLATIGALTAMITHEVNQPLCSIRCNARAALNLLDAEDPSLDQIREILLDICRDDQRADDVVKRIRGLLHKRDVEFRPVDLNDAVEEILRVTATDAQRRQVRITAELAPNLPAVYGDLIQLQQVVLNVVQNGMDAMQDTPAGDRRLALRTRFLESQGCVEVEISDRGRGIPEDALGSIFDTFFTTKDDGMGVGLAIARTVVEAHGGRIWAQPGATGGAVFSFRVPTADHAPFTVGHA